MLMVSFSSLEFLFRFLPVFLIAYFVLPAKCREIVLLAGSLFFYAVGEPVFLWLLVAVTLVNYAYGAKIWEMGEGYALHAWQKHKQKSMLVQVVVLDVLVLAVMKGLSIFVDNSLLPLGISFYIFKMISYQVDILRKEIRYKPKFRSVALYFILFPQIVSGPIMRFSDGESDLSRTCSPEQFEDGLKYLVLGLGMKVLLADRLAILWRDLQMIGFQSISTPLAWLGAAGYSLQLYFDFWGYSLMASGLMVMLGYGFIENFDHPYASRSVAEFYRRWHVTLGSWFRDYVYIPLGGSHCERNRMILNLAAVWLLTGIWHGNGLNYVLWGIVLGLLVILEKVWYGKYLHKIPVVGHLYVILLIPLTWVVFAITDLRQLGIYFGRLFPFLGGPGMAVNRLDIIQYGQSYGIYFLIGIVLCIPAVFRFYEKHKKNPVILVLLAGIFWASVYFLAGSAGNPFMYLNF